MPPAPSRPEIKYRAHCLPDERTAARHGVAHRRHGWCTQEGSALVVFEQRFDFAPQGSIACAHLCQERSSFGRAFTERGVKELLDRRPALRRHCRRIRRMIGDAIVRRFYTHAQRSAPHESAGCGLISAATTPFNFISRRFRSWAPCSSVKRSPGEVSGSKPALMIPVGAWLYSGSSRCPSSWATAYPRTSECASAYRSRSPRTRCQ